ncbi:unnamed protein product [Thelazia callipaeda]|uniref:PfkB domain-containing protein n=1 Tax=Thelazia callipaeda TaxID=103827 RepID=A0A0N5CMR1_THECL|nr:unnamed protein product [Thelazia callipaeda]
MVMRPSRIFLVSSSLVYEMDEKILIVGLTCLDIVNYVESYPVEDGDSRVVKQVWTTGGNATNNITVLNQLNSHSVLFSSIPAQCPVLESLLKGAGIKTNYCIRRSNSELPISTIIVSESTGSRTILHYRGQLQEPNCREFQDAFPDISRFSWIHFEGRNFENVISMIRHVRKMRQNNEKPTISLECEKVRNFPTLEDAIPLVDVLFISKDFARNKGFRSKEQGVSGIQEKYCASNVIVICPWAEKGAAARSTSEDEMISVNSYHENKAAIDTVGAGDCFIACCIHYLNEGCGLRETLRKSCRIAGKKVTQRGLLDLDLS